MKTFFSEYRVDYSTYTFGYTAYCLKESSDSFDDIYQLGFLPFTGELKIKDTIFYMARSLRVDVSLFSNSSENRRIEKKVANLDLSFHIFRKEDFDINNASFREICLTYAAERFVENSLNPDRLEYILNCKTMTHIFEYRLQGKPFGYILTCLDTNMIHYWFSFFDVNLMKSHAIGKWMMWSVIDWAKHNNLNYVYLGTAYNTKSLYKIRDFKGAAFFDGVGWNSDITVLKKLCKSDDIPRDIDRFKEQDFFDDLLAKLS